MVLYVVITVFLKTIQKQYIETLYTVLIHVKQLLILYHSDAPWYSLQQSHVTLTPFLSTNILGQLHICVSAAQPAINLGDIHHTVL